MSRAPLAAFAAVLLPLAACRCADPPSPESAVGPSTAGSTPDPTLSGRVLYRGDVPPPRPAPPPCTPPPSLLRGADGGLADVLVRVADLPGAAPGELEISGDGCVYSPHVAVVPVGTQLVVANDGAELQTFHLRRLDAGKELQEQNLALPPGKAVLRYPLDRPGRYRVADDVRPWMEAFVWVVPAGATAITDGSGRFGMDVPAGEWTAELWHPALGSRLDAFEVPHDGPGSLYVTWSPSEAGSR